MRNINFLMAAERIASFHRQAADADFAYEARRRAVETEARMLGAEPTGALGDGRLASLADIEASGQFGSDGIFLGGLDGRLLFYNGEAPLLTVAMTGSGKGRDLILPNLAHLRGRSLIILDPKFGENAFASADHRQHVLREKCIFLNPFGIGGDRFPNTCVNPLQRLVAIASAGQMLDTQAIEIAHIIIPQNGEKGGDSWVRDGAIRLVATYLEYLAHFSPERCTLESLWSFINTSEFELGANFALMTTCGISSIEGRAHSFQYVWRNVEKQWAAYASAIADAVPIFAPGGAIANATCAHEFDFEILKEEPHSVYLMVPSDKLEAVAPWISLTVNHAVETIAAKAGPVRTTLILDELAQLNPMRALTKALLLYRGRGIQPWAFLQSRTALDDRWGKTRAREFENQAAIMTIRGADDPQLMRDIELWSGNRTILQRGLSHNGGTVETAAANLGETKRPVLQSEDIKALGSTRHIIKVAMMPHLIVSDCIPYFDVDPWASQIADMRQLHNGEAR